MDKQAKLIILKKIEDRSEISNEDDCVIWNGSFELGGRGCILYHELNGKKSIINIIRFLWTQNYPDIPIKPTEKLARNCDNAKCVNIEHINIKPLEIPISKQEVWERLLKKSKRNKNIEYDGKKCLELSGYKHQGYGRISIKNNPYLTHRVSYWIHHDEYDNIEDIPKNNEEEILDVAHLCNNAICFEAAHLKLCGRLENSNDKLANGTLSRGIKSNFCTITEELAQEIKLSKTMLGDENYMTAKQRSEKFGVSLHVVNNIDRGNSWGHVPDKNGNTSSDATAYVRKRHKIAKQRIWSMEDFKNAQKKLESKSVLDGNGIYFEDSQCILWTGQKNEDGYGRIKVNGREFRAHILACCIKNNSLETNCLQVRHLCGKRSCINPNHLMLGTAKENKADQVIHGTSLHKLNVKTANKIRSQYKTRKYTYLKLGKIYSVSESTISKIIRNKIYRSFSQKIFRIQNKFKKR
jgi:hypothetical protein